jgi:hypothetical protein
MSEEIVTQAQATSNMTVLSEHYLYLTPKLFERLDLLARVWAGKALAVFDLDRERGSLGGSKSWAHCSPQAAGIYRKGRQQVVDEKSVLHIANKIPLEEIRTANRPELDMGSDIPMNCIYEFLVWHEIEHSLNGDGILAFNIQIGDEPKVKDKETRIGIAQAMELQADRGSYERLFPRGALLGGYRDKESQRRIQQIESYFPLLEELRGKWKNRREEFKPAPVTPGEYMLKDHRDGDIPWAKEIEALVH